MNRPELKEIATRKVVELINWFHFHKAGFATKEHPEVIDTMSEILALLDCEQRIKEAIDTAIKAYESTCEALIEEARHESRGQALIEAGELCRSQIENAEKQERKEHWIDVPNKRGDYWLSPFIEGKYISPRLMSVIDYQRPDRGLEVQHDRLGETIPIKLFCEEYYPQAKWLFIPKPNWQALKSLDR